jgi:hypothetical protein
LRFAGFFGKPQIFLLWTLGKKFIIIEYSRYIRFKKKFKLFALPVDRFSSVGHKTVGIKLLEFF